MVPRHVIDGILTCLIMRSGGYESFKRLERTLIMTCAHLHEINHKTEMIIIKIAIDQMIRSELNDYERSVFTSVLGNLVDYYEYNTIN